MRIESNNGKPRTAPRAGSYLTLTAKQQTQATNTSKNK